jgi:hypothetical protein
MMADPARVDATNETHRPSGEIRGSVRSRPARQRCAGIIASDRNSLDGTGPARHDHTRRVTRAVEEVAVKNESGSSVWHATTAPTGCVGADIA